MQRGDRWPHRDLMAFAYGADRPMSAICAAERTYKLLKDAQTGDGVDIELQAKVVSAVDMLCQRLNNEFNPVYHNQMVGLLRKFLSKVDEGFIDPGSDKGVITSTAVAEPERAWVYWLGRAREQLCLASYVLDMMREHKVGSERVVICGKGFMISVNPLVYEDNAQIKAAALYRNPGLESWSWRQV